MEDLNELYRLIIERTSQAIVVTRGTGPLFFNDAYLTLLGFERGDKIIAEWPFPHVHHDDRPMVVDYNQRRIRGEDAPSTYEIRMVRKDGKVLDVEVSSSLIIYRGEPASLVFLHDITSRKQALQALAESEEKYRQVVEGSVEAIFIAQGGKVKFPNSATLALVGTGYEEVTTRSFIDFVHPEDREMVRANHAKRIRGEEVPSIYEFRIIDCAGKTRWVELHSVSIEWEGQPATLNFIMDVTEKRALEARQVGARKMEAIGTLAGGIAHDFNNILMGIMGHTALMLLDVEDTHPHYERLKAIETQVQAAADLTRQLLEYARSGRYEVVKTDINDLVRRMVFLFGRSHKTISLRENYDPRLWSILADRGQMEEVFLQLLLLARMRMPHGGTISIRTENLEVNETFPLSFPLALGRYIRVSISDTGESMDRHVRERLFEPYFTTREMGHGVGLGLAAVYGIIKGHRGGIEVSSEKGRGTTFYLYLPALVEHERGAEGKKFERASSGPRKAILVVEDEKPVAEVTRAMINQLGYDVRIARSGSEALELFEEQHPDLTILDMVMPGMTGKEVYDRIRIVDPQMKVLVVSGYALSEDAEDILAHEGTAFLRKPYRLGELADKIRELISV